MTNPLVDQLIAKCAESGHQITLTDAALALLSRRDFHRFADDIAAEDESYGDGCWIWTGPYDREGYGYLSTRSEKVRAHRIAWRIATDLPPLAILDHRCHGAELDRCSGGVECLHRRCVRPGHLVESSVRENTRLASSPALTLDGRPCRSS